MRVVPQRSMWLQVAVWVAGLLLGPLAALRMSAATAPDSEIVQVAAVLGFVLIFLGGTFLWMGFGFATVVLGGMWSLMRGRRPGPGGLEPSQTMVPKGYRSYVASGVLVGLLVGLLAGFLTDLPRLAATAIWWGMGSGYGFLLWLAAHHGYLPFPEPD